MSVWSWLGNNWDKILAGATVVAGWVGIDKLWTKPRQKAKATIEEIASMANDALLFMIVHEKIPVNAVQIVVKWNERLTQLAYVAGLKLDGKLREKYQMKLYKRLNEYALGTGNMLVADAARALVKTFTRN